MALLFNPEYLIITGGVSKGARHFLSTLKESLKKFNIKTPINDMEIRVSDNPDLGSYGAALYSLQYRK